MEDTKIDRETMGKLAKALNFIQGPGNETSAALKLAAETGTEADIKKARTLFLRLKSSDRASAFIHAQQRLTLLAYIQRKDTMKNILSLLCLGLIAAATPALAQHEHHATASAKAGAPVDVYASAMDKMHKDMMITPTGDADTDFVRGMIPHHQGAIDMAKILKEKGKDPELQKLADEIIAAQDKEIAFMQDWLKKHGK